MRNRLVAVAATVAAAAAVVGTVVITQTGDSLETRPYIPGPSAPVSSADLARVAVVAGRASQFDWVSPSDDLTDLLPNVRYRQPDGTTRPTCDLVVRGKVVRVEPGPGWRNRTEKEIAATDSDVDRVAFDNPQADFWTAHLVVRVLERIDNFDEPGPAEVRVGVVLYQQPDLASLTRGFQAADSYVFFLEAGSPVYDYDASLYAIAHNTQALTEVDKQGGLSLPGLDDKEAARMLRTASTLAQLKDAAARPTEIRKAKKARGLA